MKYTQKREKNTLTITFKVDAEEWASFDKRAYEQNKGRYNVPGFRKGHAPKSVLEQRYGKRLFFEDALYIAAQEYYSQFLDKNKSVTPVDRPSIDDKSLNVDDKGVVTFAVVVTVKPEVKLGQYKGLTVKKSKRETVKADDVDAELNKMVERNARYSEVTDRPIEDGDQVNLDYSGKIDGTPFKGGTAQKQTLTIGSHSFIEGFEEQLVGMTVGQTKDIDVTFPQDYHAEDLAGKPVVFTVTVNGITHKELPELNDDFAKDVSEFSTLKELKADIKKHLAEKIEEDAKNKDESALVEKIVDGAEMDIPQVMFEDQITDYVEDFSRTLSYQGLSIDNYFKYTNSTMEQLREQYKERAEKAVKTRLVFEAIVDAEKIKATKKEIDKKIAEYAEKSGEPLEELTASLTDQDRYYFENQAITENLIDFLKKENTIE